MDFAKAFTFVFDDRDWLKKIGIAGLIALVSIVLTVIVIGILGFVLLLGWMIELTRRVINRDPVPLPDWDDFGGYFSKGFKALVVSLVYSLPAILISACVNVIPLIAGGMDSGSGSAEALGSGIALLSLCLGCFSFIYGIFLAVVLPAAFAQLAVTDNIGAAFRFGEVIGLVRANPGAYVLVLLGTILAQIIASLGLIACGIGVAFTYAYSMAVQGHLYGQAYNAASPSRGGAAVYPVA